MRHGDTVETARLMPAPVDEVWAALTDPSSLAEWFGADVLDFDATTGGRLVVRDAGAVRRAYVEECRPGERLVLRWLPIEELPDGSTYPFAQTTVEIAIMETAQGTLVTIRETYGFTSAPRPSSDLLARA